MRDTKGITLITLIISIIILLILSGITIVQITKNGLLENAKLAKEEHKNAEELENAELLEYNNILNNYIENSNRDTNKSGYRVTLLWEDSGQTDNKITFLDSHKFSEFDTIRFRIIDNTNEHWGTEIEISIQTINELINNNKNIGLYGYYTNNVSLNQFVENGFQIESSSVYKIYKIYGVNY